MRNWEEKYEKLKNGDFDAKIDELKAKVDAKTATKDEFEEYKKLFQAKKNIPKVENVIEYRDKTKKLLEEINEEINTRENLKKITEENEKLERELNEITEELEAVENALKAKDLTPEKREELTKKKSEIIGRRDDNNQKYAKNQEELTKGLGREGRLKDYTEKELEDLKMRASSRISKCNMVANSLINGLSWKNIDLKLENWKDKKFTNKGKKITNKEKGKEEIEEKDEYEDVISSEEEIEEKDEYEDVISSEEELRNKNKTFAQRHPRLAKIENFFKKIFKKEKALPEALPETLPEENSVIAIDKEDSKDKILGSDESFREEIKYIAEYGHKDVRKGQLRDKEDLKRKLEEMRKANREAEAKKFGQDYADKSDYRNKEDDGSER